MADRPTKPAKRLTLPLRGSPRPSSSPEVVVDRKPALAASSRLEPIVVDSGEDDELEEVPVPAGSTHHAQGGDDGGKKWRAEEDAEWKAKAGLREELKKLDDELEPLKRLHNTLTSQRAALQAQLARPTPSRATTSKATSSSDKQAINYQSSSFPWSAAIRATASRTFNIPSFRLCQEGVINAAMDGRDIVCVMPTGGGKSLTYQLPAVVGAKGLTVVISPLLALIWDQVRGLKEIGVECAMMTGATSKEEQNEIHRRIESGHGRALWPEKIAKSKRLISSFGKAHSAGRLTRFVIAHCCSQLGHDFRPDYKNLSTLKKFFPDVAILAVTATLSTKTMPDLLQILRLPPVCDGHDGTVFFSAPLYRPNLLYQVQLKPTNAKAAIKVMSDWILNHHPGIVYCLSKNDAEAVANSLREISNGAIKTGVYHAGKDDSEKEQIHVRWRQGKINCICATIAFGMGIDKGDVRYVIHHSMSKSLDGYYQETGRAGRDGQDSDCVLFYRGQDASRLLGMVAESVDGTDKFREMLRFAQDLKTCRKVAFAKYFATSANLSASAWDHADALSSTSGSVSVCGHCDNCTRDPQAIIDKDVTLDVWRILRVLGVTSSQRGKLTLTAVANLVRGLGGGRFAVEQSRGGRAESVLDVNGVAGGKVGLSTDDTETLLVHLWLLGYLKENTVNVYFEPGPQAIRISRLSQDAVEAGAAPLIECTFSTPPSRKRKSKAKDDAHRGDAGTDDDDEDGKLKKLAKKPRKKAEPKPKASKKAGAVASKPRTAVVRRPNDTGAGANDDWATDACLSSPENVWSSDGPTGIDEDLLEAEAWVEAGGGGSGSQRAGRAARDNRGRVRIDFDKSDEES